MFLIGYVSNKSRGDAAAGPWNPTPSNTVLDDRSASTSGVSARAGALIVRSSPAHPVSQLHILQPFNEQNILRGRQKVSFKVAPHPHRHPFSPPGSGLLPPPWGVMAGRARGNQAGGEGWGGVVLRCPGDPCGDSVRGPRRGETRG